MSITPLMPVYPRCGVRPVRGDHCHLIDEDGTSVPLRSSAAADGPSLRLSTRLSSRADADAAKSGTCGAVMNLSNTVLGAGVLAMPFACAQCGVALFFVLLTAVAVGAHLSIRLLAISS